MAEPILKCPNCNKNKSESSEATTAIKNEQTGEYLNTGGWCGICINIKHFELCKKDGNGIWLLVLSRERDKKCEKCQRNSVEVQLTEEKTQKTSSLCKDCAFEYSKCDKCQRKCDDIAKWDEWQKDLTTTEKDGQKIKVCSDCKNKGGDNSRKCDDCKVKKATIFTGFNPNDPNDKSAYCKECKQKRRDREPRGDQEKQEQIKIIFEKVLERCPEEAFKPLGEQNEKKNWCVYTPIWVKRITKEEARELKELCQGANPKLDIPYEYWLSQDNYKYDFEKTLPEFIKELDKIIDGEENGDKNQNHNEYTCERCHTSCWKDQGDQGPAYYRKRITHWYTDFRKTVNYFCIDGDYGNSVKKGNSKCTEEFKKEHFQTCPNCNKTEWPDMDKGWMLDYEIHKAFCSSRCHVEYRQLSWEQASNLTQIQMHPPQLDISNSGNQPNFDWEKEGLKREVLFWREYAKELEKKLATNQNNLTPEERQQANYLQKLQQNTLNSAEKSYKDKYGKLTEDNPNDNKGKGISGGMIALLIVSGIVIVGIIIFLLTRSKKKTRK